MQHDELKKSMSTLEQILAKTNADIKIDVTASETAKAKILDKYRNSSNSCIIIALVLLAMIFGGFNPRSLPVELKIYLIIYLSIAAAWYRFLSFKLRDIDIATLSPARLFAKTGTLRLLTLSGEIVLFVGLAVLYTLLIPKLWMYSTFGFWGTIIFLAIGVTVCICYYVPRYVKLFRELNSIK